MISSFMSKVTLLRVESVEARPDSRPMAGCSGDLHDCDADCDDAAGSLSGPGLPPLASHATDDAAGAYADDQDDEWLLGAGF